MKKKDVDNKYYKYFEGRPNIFILFIIKSLCILNDNGILSFVLPKSFLNCLYYDKTRKYINDNYQILHIIENKDSYIETNQETITLIIKKINKDIKNTEYIINIEGFTIFGTPENIVKLKSLYLNSSTLNNLGFTINVGNIVWNQCKKDLTNDSNKTLLIYSSDIKNKRLEIQSYSNNDKKNYIDRKGYTEPILVINRGYGVGKYSFDYCLINEDYEYLIENHLICIKYKNEIDKEDLIKLYNKIITSFENKDTIEFIQLYFGNNAINTTELYNIFPIYDI
jgi:adenine-specific DNA-methyltransferase